MHVVSTLVRVFGKNKIYSIYWESTFDSNQGLQFENKVSN